ncbi:ROK family protein [Alkalihalobacterium alkalinitrilicum]|uniref:ROK family protein n=1 Tax=Alkalihalobacterium alkalinitrilicum TaxID=427920 RepID=UPI0009957856|nr:ROK family protein [Alkalihalobacterium alkalinitrilicum]
MLIAVFDIGGTSIKYGVANKEGQLLFSSSVPTDAYLGGAAVIQKVVLLSKELMKKWDIHGVSISTAGQIDSDNGIVVYATDNIPNYTGLNIEERIYDQLKLPVKVENDVNCTAIGEHWQGAAQNTDDFLCITLGTGVGGALFLNGRLYTGQGFSAGEIGHMTLYPHGEKCTCGSNGCYEQYASSSALEDLVSKKYGHAISLIDFFVHVKSGETKSIQIYNQWIDDLTTGLKTLIHIINPKLIVIGGGISEQGEFLLNSIKNSVYQKVMPNHARNLEIQLAEYGNKANLLGATKNFMMQFEIL